MIKLTESLFDKKIVIYSNQLENKKLCEVKRKNKKGTFVSDSSVIRARSRLIDYAKNNIFNYMITITFDEKKFSASNLFVARKKIIKYFNNYKNRYDSTFRFIIIPELGSENKRLHFHGLIYCESPDKLDLKFLFIDKKLKTKKYRSEWFFKNFGANTFEKINNYSLGCVSYITKYITKDVLNNCALYSCSYFCSRGLKTSKTIYSNDGSKKDLFFNFVSYLNDLGMFKSYDFCDFLIMSNDCFSDLFATSFLEFPVV